MLWWMYVWVAALYVLAGCAVASTVPEGGKFAALLLWPLVVMRWLGASVFTLAEHVNAPPEPEPPHPELLVALELEQEARQRLLAGDAEVARRMRAEALAARGRAGLHH